MLFSGGAWLGGWSVSLSLAHRAEGGERGSPPPPPASASGGGRGYLVNDPLGRGLGGPGAAAATTQAAVRWISGAVGRNGRAGFGGSCGWLADFAAAARPGGWSGRGLWRGVWWPGAWGSSRGRRSEGGLRERPTPPRVARGVAQIQPAQTGCPSLAGVPRQAVGRATAWGGRGLAHAHGLSPLPLCQPAGGLLAHTPHRERSSSHTCLPPPRLRAASRAGYLTTEVPRADGNWTRAGCRRRRGRSGRE